jgi:hypothetical protein
VHCNRKGVSTIIATILTISLAVVGSAVYFVAATSYLRPQPSLSSQVSITVGASGFTTIDAGLTNTGGVPFTSATISITGTSPQFQITYSATISANGGTASIEVRGLSGGQFSPVTPDTAVSGSFAASAGTSYAVVLDGTLSNGATYSQALSVIASP